MGIDRSVINSSGNVVVSSAEVDLEGLGDITIGTSQVEIEVEEVSASFRIRADTSNTGIIFIGKTGVLSDGSNDFARLEAGDEISFPYNDIANALYAISDTAAQNINVGVIVSV